MSSFGTRFRERKGSFPVVPYKLGVLETFDKNGKLTATANYVISPSNTPVKVERTWDELHPGPPYYTGGIFTSVKAEVPSMKIYGNRTYISRPGYSAQNNMSFRYRGGFSNPLFTGDAFPYTAYRDAGYALSFSGERLPSVAAYGPLVYKKLRPKLESAGIGQAVAELRELPHMLTKTARDFHGSWKLLSGSDGSLRNAVMTPKSVANTFLNHQFGWVPFLKDLEDIIRLYLNGVEYIDRLTRDNNRWVKRRWTFLDQTAHVLTSSSYTPVDSPSGWQWDSFHVLGPIRGGGENYTAWELYTDTYDRVWAEGSFKYYRPEFDMTSTDYYSRLSTIYRYLTIYGARISPSLIYKVTPWSWLIDWFTNLGDLIDQITDWGQDSIVARYMYLMRKSVRTVSLNVTHFFHDGTQTFKWDRFIDTKTRREAQSPYGFDLDWSLLSPLQLAILAALGLSKR